MGGIFRARAAVAAPDGRCVPSSRTCAVSAPAVSTARGRDCRGIGKMLVSTEGRTLQEVPLRIGRIIVGRTADNDLQIDSRFVSRHHCQIVTTAHSS